MHYIRQTFLSRVLRLWNSISFKSPRKVSETYFPKLCQYQRRQNVRNLLSLKNDFSFLTRCTRCTWPDTNSRFSLQYSRVTGVYRQERPDQLGANDRTVPTGSTSRRLRRKFSPVTCAILWRWWRTLTDEKFVEGFANLLARSWSPSFLFVARGSHWTNRDNLQRLCLKDDAGL